MRVGRAGLVVAASMVTTMHACAGASGGLTPPLAADAAELAELEALYRARADSARMRFTAADVSFMRAMILHHAQALVMSRLAAERGASPSVQTLASRTINAQNDEIASMRTWLEERGQEVPEVQPEAPMSDPATPPMPGMLSPEQMRELASADGRDFDRLFLTYMIQHHSGAVTMVHELFATDGAALDDTVFKLASDIQVDQTTEINRMESMLEALPSQGR